MGMIVDKKKKRGFCSSGYEPDSYWNFEEEPNPSGGLFSSE